MVRKAEMSQSAEMCSEERVRESAVQVEREREESVSLASSRGVEPGPKGP